ncbi:hypothetical protein SDC9_42546 [bioreactor metagenome]|uniref:Integrase DNA-binding domain-containing protein n=1 Tax=bioreactor metagenome TaxID=1076179 RepID=A0A644VYC2_9ZZZZ|nr:Arm DNA-binding domain-containing protein [Desulfovibrio desulfuricans]MEA4991945.1 Arm DNA-binding domain-containing protein [Desulfovibrio desulfuricans]
MPLSDISVRNAKPQQKPAKLFDGGGLFLFIAPTGGKMWRQGTTSWEMKGCAP